MAVKFLGATTASTTGTTITITVPAQTSLKPGDMLFAFFVVEAFTATTITLPSGWSQEPTPPSIGDQVVITVLRYVDETIEPFTYSFVYTTSKPIVAIMGAYRGVKQDITFSPVNYPFGYYAPAGSIGTARTQTAVTSVATPTTGSTSLIEWARAVFFFGATHASAIPKLSDPSPLIAMRAKIETAKVSAMLCDTLEDDVVNPLPSYTSAASVTLAGSIGFVRVFEPLLSKNDSLDTYKSKILRRLMPPPYGPCTFDEPLGQLLTVVGASDNDIGGLFGLADFLPDEV